jgi:hypothetical protein
MDAWSIVCLCAAMQSATVTNLSKLSNRAILDGMKELIGDGRRIVARLIAHLVVVEERRLHLDAAYSSMFDFCVRALGMSEGEAFRRITAARLVRKFPRILPMIASGDIHLSALVQLRDYLRADNHVALLAEASGKSKRDVLLLLAERFPQADVPASIRKLPHIEIVPSMANDGRKHLPAEEHSASLQGSMASAESPHPTPLPRRPLSMIEPLALARFKVVFTARAELERKMARAQELMSHRTPNADLADIVEEAFDLLLVKLERQVLGKVTHEPKAPRPTSPTSKHVPRAARREVIERDGEQCSFVSAAGDRCPSRAFLEIDHVKPRALGGTNEPSNLRPLCRAHNRLAAEETFGRAHIERSIDLRRRKSASKNATRTSSPPLDQVERPSTKSPEARKVAKAATPGGPDERCSTDELE